MQTSITFSWQTENPQSSTEIRRFDGSPCRLSRLEAALLRYLSTHAGKVVTRAELLAGVWNLNPQRVKTRTIDMHVSKLRQKLGDTADEPPRLVTLHRRGYMLRATGDETVAEHDLEPCPAQACG